MGNRQSNPRVSLTKSQLQEVVGAELYSLCQAITADGVLSAEEIKALSEWLRQNKDAGLPGVAFLIETINSIIKDGRITHDEQTALLESIEKVLPPEARKSARAARKTVETKRRAINKVRREEEYRRELELEWRRSPEDDFDFMIAGVQFDNRHMIISQCLQVGDRVVLVADPDNPTDDCAVAITLLDGSKIGYVPRDESIDVTGCLEDWEYYVAKVKKILTKGRVPIPVISLEFYRKDQSDDIRELRPHYCRRPGVQDSYQSPSKPWWKFW